jgi:hypothetical protein
MLLSLRVTKGTRMKFVNSCGSIFHNPLFSDKISSPCITYWLIWQNARAESFGLDEQTFSSYVFLQDKIKL